MPGARPHGRRTGPQGCPVSYLGVQSTSQHVACDRWRSGCMMMMVLIRRPSNYRADTQDTLLDFGLVSRGCSEPETARSSCPLDRVSPATPNAASRIKADGGRVVGGAAGLRIGASDRIGARRGRIKLSSSLRTEFVGTLEQVPVQRIALQGPLHGSKQSFVRGTSGRASGIEGLGLICPGLVTHIRLNAMRHCQG
jgi:hypothetical protein